MQYAELLRARRALIWYGSIFLACAALCVALVSKDGSLASQIARSRTPVVPFVAILAGSGFGPILLAGFMAVGLDAEFKTAAIAWTRPVARLRIAAAYVAVDVGTLLVAWLFTVAVALLGIVLLGLAPYLTLTGAGDLRGLLPLTFGVALMWYGLVVLVTMLIPGRGNAIVGASWGYALFVPGLAAAPFPSALHQVLVALNYLNPLAYLSNDGPHRRGTISIQGDGGSTLLGGSATVHTLIPWTIAVVAVLVATRLWAEREVPA
ncbi:MAG TPA: hypothetical protein VGC96_06385 [Candidatus Elarobacter sp.]